MFGEGSENEVVRKNMSKWAEVVRRESTAKSSVVTISGIFQELCYGPHNCHSSPSGNSAITLSQVN